MTCWPRANGTSDASTERPRSAIALLTSSVSAGANVCRKWIGGGPLPGALLHAAKSSAKTRPGRTGREYAATTMALTLHHHPFSRAAGVVWTLEEVGVPYDLKFVDFAKGEHKSPEHLALNPMGKIPVLVDGDTVVTEGAA